MKTCKKVVGLVFLVMTSCQLSVAATPADNSKVNNRDSSSSELTADQQRINESDTLITARIRKDIMKEKKFSTYAQNIKIITVNGKVTLKGPVRTSAEANSILRSARSVAGMSNVVNEISVAPEKTY